MKEEQIIAFLSDPSSFDKGFKAMVYAYQEKLYWHIRKLASEHEDANDILQNTFIKAYKGLKKFEGNSSLYTWLYRIATNESLTYLKKKQKTRVYAIDSPQAMHLTGKRAEIEMDGDEIAAKLTLAMESLPDKQRLVFQMRYYDEMDYKNISEILDTSVGALKASYHHAVKKIETYIKTIE